MGISCASQSDGTSAPPAQSPTITVPIAPSASSSSTSSGDQNNWVLTEVRSEGFSLLLPPNWLQLPTDPATLEASIKEATKRDPKLAATVRAQAQALISNKVKFIAFDLTPEASATGHTPNINVIKQALTQGVSLDSYVEANLSGLEKTAGLLKPITQQRVQLTTGEAEEVRYRLAARTPAGLPTTLAIRQYALIQDRTAYIITCSTTAGQSESFTTTFRNIANSLSLVN